MDNSGLTAVSALGGYEGKFDETHAREVSPLVIVSVSVPRNGMEALNKKLHALWQTSFPETGECIHIDNTHCADNISALVLYGLQADQCFLVAEPNGISTHDIVDDITDVLGPVAYLTDQSDSWTVLDIDGTLTMSAMERICMLDLASFQPSQVARTTMEHLSIIVEKQSNERIRLFSPRSSALSFLHAVTTSLHNVEQTSMGDT